MSTSHGRRFTRTVFTPLRRPRKDRVTTVGSGVDRFVLVLLGDALTQSIIRVLDPVVNPVGTIDERNG